MGSPGTEGAALRFSGEHSASYCALVIYMQPQFVMVRDL